MDASDGRRKADGGETERPPRRAFQPCATGQKGRTWTDRGAGTKRRSPFPGAADGEGGAGRGATARRAAYSTVRVSEADLTPLARAVKVKAPALSVVATMAVS